MKGFRFDKVEGREKLRGRVIGAGEGVARGAARGEGVTRGRDVSGFWRDRTFMGAKKHLYEWVRPSVRYAFGGFDVLISPAWPVLALVHLLFFSCIGVSAHLLASIGPC